jgi:hypothetical protein
MNRHLEEAGFTVLGARPLYVHRLLVEESPTYRRLTERRGSRWIERAARFALRGRDGHMLAVWGRRD